MLRERGATIVVGRNNKYLGTKSAKLRRIVPIKNFIIDLIDNDQDIKRLTRYYSKTPLLNRGVGYDGGKIVQPDLLDTLTLPIVKDNSVSETAKGRVLFSHAFSGDVLAERQVTIYIYCYKSTYNPNITTNRAYHGIDEVVGKHFFNIDIVYPLEFNDLDSRHEERANQIACKITDLIDGVYIENEFQEFTGNCQICIAGEVSDLRLSTSGYMIMTIPLYVQVLGGHVDVRELGGETRYD